MYWYWIHRRWGRIYTLSFGILVQWMRSVGQWIDHRPDHPSRPLRLALEIPRNRKQLCSPPICERILSLADSGSSSFDLWIRLPKHQEPNRYRENQYRAPQLEFVSPKLSSCVSTSSGCHWVHEECPPATLQSGHGPTDEDMRHLLHFQQVSLRLRWALQSNEGRILAHRDRFLGPHYPQWTLMVDRLRVQLYRLRIHQFLLYRFLVQIPWIPCLPRLRFSLAPSGRVAS